VARAHAQNCARRDGRVQGRRITCSSSTKPPAARCVFTSTSTSWPRHDGIALLPPASRKEDVKVLEDQRDPKLIAALQGM